MTTPASSQPPSQPQPPQYPLLNSTMTNPTTCTNLLPQEAQMNKVLLAAKDEKIEQLQDEIAKLQNTISQLKSEGKLVNNSSYDAAGTTTQSSEEPFPSISINGGFQIPLSPMSPTMHQYHHDIPAAATASPSKTSSSISNIPISAPAANNHHINTHHQQKLIHPIPPHQLQYSNSMISPPYDPQTRVSTSFQISKSPSHHPKRTPFLSGPIKTSLRFHPSSDKPTKELGHRKRILDPQGSFLQMWNKIFVLSCVIAVSLDPLFFYIPVIKGKEKCLDLDKKLQITACVLRTFTDIFYILHILFQFRTGFIAPSSQVFGTGELIKDAFAIAKKYLSSYFIIDILSVLPLPQEYKLKEEALFPVRQYTKKSLKFIILSQYVPRFIRIYPLYKGVTRTSGISETAWAGAAFNVFLYMLASHVVGALWYFSTIERQVRCWHVACDRNKRSYESLYCEEDYQDNSFLQDSCLLEPNAAEFDFGIFLDALQSRVVETRDFPNKLLYCFWWGLRGLSSLGQNLKTSTFVGEILFADFISISGLVLFSLVIGNMMQKYLRSITIRVEEMRVKRQDAEQWMSRRMLPDNLREQIRRYEQYKWKETRGVEEESLILSFPKDIRRDIKRHLLWDLLKRVPLFEKMDQHLLDAMCNRLKPVLYIQKSFIVREGGPTYEMLFVMQGTLMSLTTDGGRIGFFNSAYLKAGDFCGEELLTWALDPKSSSTLPNSTRTVEAVTDVEAFAIMADDLKFVASQFRQLHSKKIRHTFRFYSQQWRTWAACFIQVAWRRHCRRKIERSLREEEDRLQDASARDDGSSPSLCATIYASKFAANELRNKRAPIKPQIAW